MNKSEWPIYVVFDTACQAVRKGSLRLITSEDRVLDRAESALRRHSMPHGCVPPRKGRLNGPRRGSQSSGRLVKSLDEYLVTLL